MAMGVDAQHLAIFFCFRQKLNGEFSTSITSINNNKGVLGGSKNYNTMVCADWVQDNYLSDYRNSTLNLEPLATVSISIKLEKSDQIHSSFYLLRFWPFHYHLYMAEVGDKKNYTNLGAEQYVEIEITVYFLYRSVIAYLL